MDTRHNPLHSNKTRLILQAMCCELPIDLSIFIFHSAQMATIFHELCILFTHSHSKFLSNISDKNIRSPKLLSSPVRKLPTSNGNDKNNKNPLTRQYFLIEANAPLKLDTSCSLFVSSKRPGPWLKVHWHPYCFLSSINDIDIQYSLLLSVRVYVWGSIRGFICFACIPV